MMKNLNVDGFVLPYHNLQDVVLYALQQKEVNTSLLEGWTGSDWDFCAACTLIVASVDKLDREMKKIHEYAGLSYEEMEPYAEISRNLSKEDKFNIIVFIFMLSDYENEDHFIFSSGLPMEDILDGMWKKCLNLQVGQLLDQFEEDQRQTKDMRVSVGLSPDEYDA